MPVNGASGQKAEKPSKVSRRGYYSPDIANTFGLSIEEHRQAYSLTDLDGYVTIGTLTQGTNVGVASGIKTAAVGDSQDREQEVSVNTLSGQTDRLSDRDITLPGRAGITR